MRKIERACGILLHPISLPGRYGIGDLGASAAHWLDFLEQAGQSFWQVLPLGPTGQGNSPYASPSTFAGNSLLVDLDALVEEGDLLPEDLVDELPSFPPDRVDYAQVIPFKLGLLQRAAARFASQAGIERKQELVAFQTNHSWWLDDFAFFAALKERFAGLSWDKWPVGLAMREPKELAVERERLAEPISIQVYIQFQFYRQWKSLIERTHLHGIYLIGDIPIFPAYDSVEVWLQPELYLLDEARQPLAVAGVPPDFFSPTGQRWGNPLYRWERMAQNGFDWWIRRIRHLLGLVDLIRLDHFRGFEAYWQVPAAEPTAEHGSWEKGPGELLFKALQESLGELPFIAEDLGVITPEVEKLRKSFGMPGMKVLQFAFDSDGQNLHLPHNYERETVVYTGTHDNNTTQGWLAGLPPVERKRVLEYLGTDGEDVHWDFIRLAYHSVEDLSIVRMQDVLGLSSQGCMNRPGSDDGNWEWRMSSGVLTKDLSLCLKQ
ncbi:MAG: 4-alpha-glucanotransferase, partial [Coprothermobacterota bacterium]|nr:4-alpha-glucanotransferase [Coprothermobacterota bacterium]